MAWTRIATACWLALVLGSLAFGATPKNVSDRWPAARHDGPILIVLTNGSQVAARGPVEGDNRTLVFRTEAGKLVSLPTTSIGEIRLPPKSAGQPDTEPDGESEEMATPDPDPEAQVIFSNADLPPAGSTSPLPEAEEPSGQVGGTDPGATLEDSAGARPQVATAGPVDRDGHDERWWRDRKSRLVRSIEEANAEIEKLDRDVRLAKAAIGITVQGQDGAVTLAEKNEALADALQRRAALRKELDDLPTEARRAGALPGWIR